jgi:transposase
LTCAAKSKAAKNDLHNFAVSITPIKPQLTESLLLRWRREFEQRGEAAFCAKDAAEVSPTALLEQKVAELERFCGQLSLENALLKKLVSTQHPHTGAL